MNLGGNLMSANQIILKRRRIVFSMSNRNSTIPLLSDYTHPTGVSYASLSQLVKEAGYL